MAHTCVTAWARMPRRVSRATSFEMNFSRTVPRDMSVPKLRPSPHVGGCYIHPLSGMVYVNDIAQGRARESQCLDRTWMDRCLGRSDEMSDTWARSR